VPIRMGIAFPEVAQHPGGYAQIVVVRPEGIVAMLLQAGENLLDLRQVKVRGERKVAPLAPEARSDDTVKMSLKLSDQPIGKGSHGFGFPIRDRTATTRAARVLSPERARPRRSDPETSTGRSQAVAVPIRNCALSVCRGPERPAALMRVFRIE